MDNMLKKFKRLVVGALQGMLMLVVLFSVLELAFSIFHRIGDGAFPFIGLGVLLELLGSFLLILIGLELLDTMTVYLRESLVSADAAEVVLIVAITAVCRKAIVLDYHGADAVILFGIAAIILALSISHYLLRKARTARKVDSETAFGKEEPRS